VDARSALFDLYGDHLRSRGSRAPIAALVRMLAPLGITAPAVRTAVSRMAGQGWLEAVRLPGGARSRLFHEWRKFLFRDPGLPAELLPSPWPGRQAAEVFDAESARLLPAASRFVDCCLRPRGPGPPGADAGPATPGEAGDPRLTDQVRRGK